MWLNIEEAKTSLEDIPEIRNILEDENMFSNCIQVLSCSNVEE